MSVTVAVSGEAVKNNGGTVLAAGTPAAGSPITKVIAVNDINSETKFYGSKLVVQTAVTDNASDPHGCIKALSSGSFAYTPPAGTNFLIRAAGSTNAGKINGTASTFLTTPNTVPSKSIHKLTSTRRIGAYASTVFDIMVRPNGSVHPNLTRGAGAGNLAAFVQTDGVTTTGVDEAASPTRAVPGELTYMFGGKNPKSSDYSARDSHE